MSEMGESYDPGPWKGFDFKSARAGYVGTGRSYATPNIANIKNNIRDYVPERISTDCKSPLVFIVDGTGSMGQFPKIMFEKLPLLDLGVEDYLEDYEVSVAMIGDAGSDKYALQVQPFRRGTDLVESLNNLVIEGNGGGNQVESYDLAALYYARNVDMPNAIKPVMVFVCDEGIYANVNKDWANDYSQVTLEDRLPSKDIFEELKSKFSVYAIRKHYNGQMKGDKMYGSNLAIHNQWEEYLGDDKIAILNDPRRVVDVTFGLLANETGKSKFFKKELNFRQTSDQVSTVMKSMMTVGKSHKPKTGKSVVLRDPKKTKKSTTLL